MKVALIYPLLSISRSIIDENKQFWPPLGLAYVAGMLESHGHQVTIVDRDILLRKNNLDFNKTDEQTQKMINKFNPHIIGFSATTPNISDVIHISRIIKNNNPDRLNVLGGPHSTGEPELTLQRCPHIDMIVRGEGEVTALELADQTDFTKIAGITYRSNSRIISNPDRPPIQNLDDLPFPARHLLDMAFYSRPSRFISRNLSLRTTSIFTARGCPYRCNFCAGPLVFGRKVRFHSPERILKEIEELISKYSIEGLYFAEDMFLSSKARARKILSLFIENNLHKKIKWFAQAKVNVVDEELLRLMKDAGCVGVEYGFESGSQRILTLMNKRTTIAQNFRAANLTKKVRLRYQANIIVGFPGETEKDFKETISFLKITKPNNTGFNIFMPLPGTPSYEKLKSEGKRIPDWDQIGDPEHPENNYADMPEAKFEKLYYKARLKVILPINLYHFILDNLKNPFRLIFILLTQFKGVIIKTFRSVIKLGKLT